MNKTAIKNFSIWARNKFIDDIRYRAGLLGITENGIKTALPQSTRDTEFYDIGTANPYSISGEAVRQRRKLAEVIRRKEQDSDYQTAYKYIVEEVAYTWFNRLIAIRFMEVNDYLPSHIRVLSSESGKLEPDLVTTPFDAELSFTTEEEQNVLRLKQDNQIDELFRLLFIKQCNALNEILPGLFEKTSDYTELLLSVSVVDQDGVVYHLVHDLDENDFNIEKGGQVEIIGWLYQYWNTEPKDAVFSRPSGQKIKKEEIPAATQLFTPDWIVRYMVENSLGRLWVEGHPNEELKTNWKYYLEEAEQEPAVQAQLAEIRKEYAALNPEDIKCIDPCMGSGHILCYLFDVLMQIYESQGYSQRDAAQSIVQHNLYGLDIDKRATQLAYFSVMMKARQYDRRFFSRNLQPMVYSTTGDEDGENFGSLVMVEDLGEMPEEPQTVFDLADYEKRLNVWNYRYLLAQKYHVVVTNPPYMGASGMNGKLGEFVKKDFPDSKSDLFSCFMERADRLVKPNGFTSLITMESWMFLSSYEKLRRKINQVKTIVNMVHMPYLGKGGTSLGINFGTAAVIMQKGHIKDYSAQYEYTVYYECDKDGVPLVFPTKNERWTTAKQDNFSKIPGVPVAYWVSETTTSAYVIGTPIKEYMECKSGIMTGDERYISLWFEVLLYNIKFDCRSASDMGEYRWFPLNSGGDYRNYYGNNLKIVDLWHDGAHIRNNVKNFRLRDKDYYFRKGITWGRITSSDVAFREVIDGSLFGDAGPVGFVTDKRYYLLGFLCSKVASHFLKANNPTLNYQVHDIEELPLIISIKNELTIKQNVLSAIELSKADWDSFETSWDFKRHPLI